MKCFCKKGIIFIIGLGLTFIASYIVMDHALNSKPKKDAIYIWGDSQTQAGIDVVYLNSKSQKSYYTSAMDGAGVYDFLVFVENVPANSDIIVSLSKLSLIRRKEYDRNFSGVSFEALYSLYKSNYSLSQLVKILWNNRRPKRIFNQSSNLFPIADTIVLSQPISLFSSYYKNTPIFLKDKQNLFLQGIKKLQQKGCSVLSIEFPYHPILQQIERDSPLGAEFSEFKETFLLKLPMHDSDTIYLNTSCNMMYDLSHLNSFGAIKVSEYIKTYYIEKENRGSDNPRNTFLMVRHGSDLQN